MSERRTDELERALAALDALTRRAGGEGRPDRYHARALLVPLGALLRAGTGSERPPAAEAALERARAVGEALGAPWREAVQAELALACAEHVHAVDERYLDLPNYDFDYTFAARERLEARLVAARALGMAPSEALLEGVRRADRLLAPYRDAAGRPGLEDGGGDGVAPPKRNV